MAIFEIFNATDSLIHNIIRIICLCWLIFVFFETLETVLNYAHQFIKIMLIFQTPYLWHEAHFATIRNHSDLWFQLQNDLFLISE